MRSLSRHTQSSWAALFANSWACLACSTAFSSSSNCCSNFMSVSTITPWTCSNLFVQNRWRVQSPYQFFTLLTSSLLLCVFLRRAFLPSNIQRIFHNSSFHGLCQSLPLSLLCWSIDLLFAFVFSASRVFPPSGPPSAAACECRSSRRLPLYPAARKPFCNNSPSPKNRIRIM